MRELFVAGIGTYLPRRELGNAEMLEQFRELGPADLERIGVASRRVASDAEDVPAMAVAAAERALEQAETTAEALDFLLLVNWSERRYVPDLAPRVQALLGARRAFAFDLGCACAGFVYGLSIAHGYLQTPRFSRGLVVASDHSRRRVRPGSRAGLLFGDGAAAAVVTAVPGRGFRLVDYELLTDGERNDIMDVDAEGFLVTHVRQRALNELAVASLVKAGQAVLARQKLAFSDVDFIVPHSGTAGIQGMLGGALGLTPAKILTNLPLIGNVTAASIPMALEHFMNAGTLRQGQRVLLLAVGLGWQSVAALVQL
ncbi:MAG TPA: 3-oxoacyl-[acyl-carrier-protein] synthase III C-terminal domain-containing protein [Polyangiaceae bacterium]|jgi:3-oxoacyl-[acyl-carrier-protein] synthase-3|nr:3-oxoacyl-[acyl-carrier-protein] synthase III C-terminal domain-containing protein [Polyangiaceae bacterium]